MKRRLLFFFLLISSLATAQNNIYRSGGITQTVGAPTFTPGASGNIVAIDTVTGEWYVNPNRLSGSSWISAGYRLTNISGSVPPAYTPIAHQSHFVVNAANQLYYWNGSSWQSVGGGGSTDALRLKFIVVNKSGSTLNKGEVVYVSGAQGNRVAVKKALASADSLSANTLGVMDETVANNAEGYCVAEGLVSGINTSAFTEGAALYLSPTTPGAITQTKPTAPDHLVLIGYCVKSNAGSGEISVHIQNGYELGELHDVYVPAPSNGQVLTYNTTNTRWEAATVADQSATNELQTIDTFSLSGQTLSASLSSDNQPAKTVTLPIVDVVAGTNVTVTKSNGVATVSATGGGGGSGTVTGTGVAGRAAFWRSTSAISSDANFAWDSTNVQLNIGTPSSPTGRLNVKGSSTTSATVNTRLTDSGNTELVKVLDNGNTNIGTGFNWDNTNRRLGIGTTTPSYHIHHVGVAGVAGVVSVRDFSFNSLNQISQRSSFIGHNTDTNIGVAFGGVSNGGQIQGYSGLPATAVSGLIFQPLGGNVAIGFTSSSSARLHVRGTNSSGGTSALLVQNSNPDDIYKIENNGKISYWANAISGTTGNQTIDRPSGNVNFAAGTNALTVTNALCTTSSLVFAMVRNNDATAQIKNVVPGAGSFTINLVSNATNVTSVGFFIIN